MAALAAITLSACARHLPPPAISEMESRPVSATESTDSLNAAPENPSGVSGQAAVSLDPVASQPVKDNPAKPAASASVRPVETADPAAAPAEAKTTEPVTIAEADPLESFLEEGLEDLDEIPEGAADIESEVPGQTIPLPTTGFFSKSDEELSGKLGGLTIFRGYPMDGKTPRHFVPIVYNAAVEKWIGYFTGPKGSPYMERWLAREKRYGPILREILKDRGLPEEIVYLSMIESGFNVRAYSTARAVGLWQFISGTGKRYNLQINWWVDERRDPVRATHAAASYLGDLYQEFENWYLAFAAYNTGEGKIRKVRRNTGSESFWEMRTIPSKRVGLFPETREYVPKYMAAAIIAQAPEQFGFKHLAVPESLDYDAVTVPGGTSLYMVATAAECSFEEIKRLNPHLLRWFVPPNESSYEVRVPKGKGLSFLARFDELSQTEGLDDFRRYEWKKGDSLLSVAYRFATDPDAVSLMNGGRKEFRTGQEIVLPVPRTVEPLDLPKNWHLARKLLKRHDFIEPSWAEEVGHVVTRRENLRSIANSHGVTTNALRLWNRIDKRGRLSEGDVLTVYRYSGDAKSVALASTMTQTSEFVSYPEFENQPVNPLKGLTGEEIRYSRRRSTASAPSIGPAPGAYVVDRGDTASGIASRNGLTLAALRELNPGVNLSRIREGQRLRVARREPGPAEIRPAGKSVEQAASSPDLPRTHMVRRGENATVIGRRYGLVVSDLRRLNPGKNLEHLRVGDRIVLRTVSPGEGKAAAQKAPPAVKSQTAARPTEAVVRHRVASGENATIIARKYRITLSELRRWNPDVNLNRIRTGQRLVVREPGQKS